MTRGNILKMATALLGVLAVLTVSATPAIAQSSDPSSGQPEFGSEWPLPNSSAGLVASAAAASDWVAIAEMPAQATGIEQSPKDGSVLFTQHDLPGSASTEPDTVSAFNTAGTLPDYPIGSFGTGPGEFDRPSDVAIDINDEIYVADADNDRIQVFDDSVSPPAYVREITGGDFGGPDIALDCPTAVEYDVDASEVFVLTGDDEVRVYNPFGDFKRVFGAPGAGAGQLDNACQPSSLTLTTTHVYVTDCGNDRVVKFDLAGTFVSDVGVGSLDCPRGVDADDAGMLYVTDNADRIQVFDAADVFYGTISNPGTSLGELQDPLGIDVNPDGTIMWVADRGNNRIQVFTNLKCNGQAATHVGTAFDDAVTGTAGDDVVALGDGDDTFDGDDGDDLVCAGDGDKTINGGAGDDVITTGNGDNIVNGDEGDDTITTGTGDDTINGGEGDDIIDADDGDNTVNGNEGDDTITTGTGDDTITGGEGDDVITSGDGENLIGGDAGDDIITSGVDDDTINGGEGDDEIDASDGDNTVNGDAGDDTITTGVGIDTIAGGAGDDTITSSDGDDVIHGDAGRDRIRAGNGDDTIFGGPDIDYLRGENGEDTIDGEGGSDRLWGGPDDDLIKGDSGADRMYGGPGDDEMLGMGGQDFMWGEAGNDLMQGNFQTDNMFGGPGDDEMFGARGKDSLFGGAGNDSLNGGPNTDYLDGEAGTDEANGGVGRDKPLLAPSVRASNGQFYDGSGCVAETILNCQPI